MGHRHLTVGRPLLVRLFRPEGASLLNFETEESTFITGRERLMGSSPTQADLQKGAGCTSERALCVCVCGGVSSRKGLMLCLFSVSVLSSSGALFGGSVSLRSLTLVSLNELPSSVLVSHAHGAVVPLISSWCGSFLTLLCRVPQYECTVMCLS